MAARSKAEAAHEAVGAAEREAEGLLKKNGNRPERVVAVHPDGAVLWIDWQGKPWTTWILFGETGVIVGKKAEGFPA